MSIKTTVLERVPASSIWQSFFHRVNQLNEAKLDSLYWLAKTLPKIVEDAGVYQPLQFYLAVSRYDVFILYSLNKGPYENIYHFSVFLNLSDTEPDSYTVIVKEVSQHGT